MQDALRILKPVFWIVLAVGLIRFVLSVAQAPRPLVYVFSLTAAGVAGGVYFIWRAAKKPSVGYLHLWAGMLLLFGEVQLLIIAGLLYTWFSGRPTLYHETQRLIDFLGYEPTIGEHIGMHVLNWMVIVPTLLTWVIGAPTAYFLRRRARPAGGEVSP